MVINFLQQTPKITKPNKYDTKALFLFTQFVKDIYSMSHFHTKKLVDFYKLIDSDYR